MGGGVVRATALQVSGHVLGMDMGLEGLLSLSCPDLWDH